VERKKNHLKNEKMNSNDYFVKTNGKVFINYFFRFLDFMI